MLYNLNDTVVKNVSFVIVENGDYYRLLADGYYRISARADGFHPSFRCIHIVNTIRVGESSADMAPAPVVNYTLTPSTHPRPDNRNEEIECENMWKEVQVEVGLKFYIISSSAKNLKFCKPQVWS